MISEKDLSILSRMPVGSRERINIILKLYAKEEQDLKTIGLIDIFNYGYMMGKREERAKRKAHRSA